MADAPKTPIRLLRPVGSPLGLYLRPGRNDHGALITRLEAGGRNFSGFVLDPCLGGRQELLETANEHDLETVLDPRSVELSTEGGMARSGVSDLTWALGSEGAQTPVALRHRATEYAELLAVHAIEHNYSAVLAPTHFRETFLSNEWGDVDRELTLALRAALDQGGA